jgi:protein arginine N-methyltransferase 1
VAALVDARERLLAPGARVIPQRDRLMAAPTGPPTGRPLDGAPGEPDSLHGIDIAPVSERVRLGVHRVPATALAPLAPPASWCELDYRTITSPDAEGSMHFTFAHDARVTGIASWFDAELVPGVGFSSGPSNERSVYDCGWLPLERPLDVRKGDVLDVRLRAKHDGADYVWAWDTTLRPNDRAAPEVRLRQSNLLSLLLSASRRAHRAASFAPAPLRDARAMADSITLADGRRTLGEIGRELMVREPGRFRDESAAVRWIGDLFGRLHEQ